MNLLQHRQNQHGAVSLFVVIFATLLMIVITISFIQLMLKDQQQATASDLSQSAIDSAQSGVEDAKRILLLDQQCRNNTQPAAVVCSRVTNAVNSGECNTINVGLFDRPPEETETMIQQSQSSGDTDLQQAYTCVKITPNTLDYKGDIGINQSDIIPLRAADPAGNPTDFDSVKISWFTRDDISSITNNLNIGFPGNGVTVNLPPLGLRWAANYPALLRTQLMQSGSSFKLSDYDNGGNGNTLFLYPSQTGLANMSFSLDARRDPSNVPQQAKCINNFSLGEYACWTTLSLPAPADGNTANRNAFLRLSGLYNGAHYKVELLKGGVVFPFDHVQPKVDSTGRANDMFRRVESRIELKSDFIYPEAAVDLEGDLCKNFVITNRDADYANLSPACTP